MKKGIAILSFLFYFLASSGIVINSHYCMKRLVSVHLFESKSKVCGKCGMGMHEKNGCCHDEVKVIKMAQDQNKIPNVIYQFASISLKAIPVSAFIVTPYFNIDITRHFHNHSPPLISGQDTYLLNSVFRI